MTKSGGDWGTTIHRPVNVGLGLGLVAAAVAALLS